MKEKIGHGSFDGELPCFYHTYRTSIGEGGLLAANECSGLHSLVLTNYHTPLFTPVAVEELKIPSDVAQRPPRHQPSHR